MMHKCINVKIGGRKKRKLSQKSRKVCGNMGNMYKFCGNRGEIYKFCENRGEYAICITGLGDGRPCTSHANFCVRLPVVFPIAVNLKDF